MKSLLFLLAIGCTKDNDDRSDTGSSSIDRPPEDTAEPAEEEEPIVLNGLFSAGFAIGAVPGLIVPLQLDFAMSADSEGNRTIDSIDMRAVSADGELSEIMSSAESVPVAADGTLSVDWGPFTLDGPFSPTAGPVDLAAVMEGTILSESMVCGNVVGAIESFSMDLEGSTFGTNKWEDRILGTPSACEEVVLEEVPRIETCPEMVAGRTSDFPSGDEAREFELRFPDGYDPEVPTPLAFVYHGIGSSIDGILGSENLIEEASRTGHIIVAPQALDRGGTAAWDPIAEPGFNMDVVLFDDLLTCMSEQYAIDPSRVHVTGMSLGGIFTGTLIATRSPLIASAAPFSGGFMRNKFAGWEPIPTLVSWGGPDDVYYDQDFDQLASSMLATLQADEHFAIQCNHGMGHRVGAELWTYAFRFFTDHPQHVEPLPYATAGLPTEFPEYCSIAE